jgi:mono/diheme cytochrome c family protein
MVVYVPRFLTHKYDADWSRTMIGIIRKQSIGRAIRATVLSALAVGLLSLSAVPAKAAEVSFSKDIQPILAEKCLKCHGEEKQKGKLRVDSAEAILKGADGEAVLVPGKPDESSFYTLLVLPADHDDIMPAKGDPLTAAQAKLVYDWIAAGAEFDVAAAATPAPAPAPKAAPAPEMKKEASGPAGSFVDAVWPIFQARCVSCHGPEKQKGELRLDSPEAILKGGENGPILVAGKPDESSLYKLSILPADDPDIMPAKGDPLTDEQKQALHAWITAGADFGDWTAEAAAASMADAAAKEGKDKGPDILEVLAKDTAPASPEALAAITDLGGLAMPLDMKTPLIRVDFHLIGDKVSDGQLATLPPVAGQLTWLNLASTKVTDGGLAQTTCLDKLTRLHLERTGITDAGLVHLKGFKHLEYLNLYGTKVTDAGLEQLKGLKKLKKLFLWQTEVTKAGADGLQAALPSLAVDMGLSPDDIPSTEIAKVMPKELFTADSCCAKAAAENKVCDHPCCEEARKANTVCTKCNSGAAELLAIVAKFDEDSCCAKAFAGGKLCDHDCCKEAWAAKKACAKCNPKGAAAPAPAELAFDEGSCCAKAKADGKDCDHPCCVEARKGGKACAKCNPKANAPKKDALAFDEGSCCAKSKADGKSCDHPCCLEAAKKGEVCAKCNPKSGAPKKVALKFDEGSCCAKAEVAKKDCSHPCCVEAAKTSTVCKKCNPNA